MIYELAENIRCNCKKALSLIELTEENEALHDFIVHIDGLAQQMQSELSRVAQREDRI